MPVLSNPFDVFSALALLIAVLTGWYVLRMYRE